MSIPVIFHHQITIVLLPVRPPTNCYWYTLTLLIQYNLLKKKRSLLSFLQPGLLSGWKAVSFPVDESYSHSRKSICAQRQKEGNTVLSIMPCSINKIVTFTCLIRQTRLQSWRGYMKAVLHQLLLGVHCISISFGQPGHITEIFSL